MTRSLKSTVATMAIAAGLALPIASQAEAEPRVVASIPAVHSLVAGVMEGVGTPSLLVSGGASPHTFSLKPSQARELQDADAIFWVGDELESFLEKPLKALGDRAAVVKFSTNEHIEMLDSREGGIWKKDDHDDHKGHAHDDHDDHGKKKMAARKDDHDHDGHKGRAHGDHDDHAKKDDHDQHDDHGHHDGHAHGEHDLHIWLDPHNAKEMAEVIAKTLGKVDPANAGKYEANAEKVVDRIDKLDHEIEDALAKVKDRPYLVFHDAYQYFERRYGLAAVGSISVSPERKPGAKRIAELRHVIEDNKAVCVFAEPQFQPNIVQTLVEGTNARSGVLDPVGGSLPPGPDAWFTMMNNLAKSLEICLNPSS
ncbi:MAG: zinc ABC transporter substrate-binding protein [Rhodospirillales bacterium]|nr:zinc ABC transporter substrate-binding protein [Rhodospirillales bacterium]